MLDCDDWLPVAAQSECYGEMSDMWDQHAVRRGRSYVAREGARMRQGPPYALRTEAAVGNLETSKVFAQRHWIADEEDARIDRAPGRAFGKARLRAVARTLPLAGCSKPTAASSETRRRAVPAREPQTLEPTRILPGTGAWRDSRESPGRGREESRTPPEAPMTSPRGSQPPTRDRRPRCSSLSRIGCRVSSSRSSSGR